MLQIKHRRFLNLHVSLLKFKKAIVSEKHSFLKKCIIRASAVDQQADSPSSKHWHPTWALVCVPAAVSSPDFCVRPGKAIVPKGSEPADRDYFSLPFFSVTDLPFQ